MLVLSLALGGVTYVSYQQGNFEDGARTAVETELATEEYEALALLDFTVTYDDSIPFRQPDTIIVTIGRPEQGFYSSLPGDLQTAIRDGTGRTVDVQVRYVEVGTTATTS